MKVKELKKFSSTLPDDTLNSLSPPMTVEKIGNRKKHLETCRINRKKRKRKSN